MDTRLRDKFTRQWNEYFEWPELPITFGIGPAREMIKKAPVPKTWKCLVYDLAKIRKGVSLTFDQESLSCSGAKFTWAMQRNEAWISAISFPPENPESLKENGINGPRSSWMSWTSTGNTSRWEACSIPLSGGTS